MTTFLILLGVLVISLVVYRRWLHPLSHIPGPFIASVSGLYRTYWSLQPEFQDHFKRLHEKYGTNPMNFQARSTWRTEIGSFTYLTGAAVGPIVRYSPNGVIFNDHKLLAVAYGRQADKSDFFAANFDTAATFNRKKYEDHVASKKAIATAYSAPNLRLLESGVDNLIFRWLEALRTGTKEYGSVNLHERAGWLAIDSVSLLITGKALGFIESESDVRGLLYIKDNTFRWLGFLAIQDNLSWYVRNTWLGKNLIMARATDKSGVGVFMNERDHIMEPVFHKNGDVNRSALVEGSLINSLLEAHVAGSGMSIEDIRAEVLFALLAGSSVTPLNLWTVIFLIAKNVTVRSKLTLELARAECQGQIPSKAHIVSDEQVKKLPYLHACIQEALRFAPTISQLPRLSPRETGLDLHGKYVPPGFSVSTSPWVIGRNRDLYGVDADIFRPERWVEACPTQLRYWHRNGFHFGYGGRKCAARRFALTLLYKTVAEIFRRFDVQIVGTLQEKGSGRPSTKQFRFILKEAAPEPDV